MSNKPTKDRHTNHKELYLDSQDSNSPSSPYNNDQG